MNQITRLAAEKNLRNVEATQPMVIEVNQDDVRFAIRKDPTNCAFSVACRRSDKRIIAAYFFRSVAWLQYPKKLVRYHLPHSMQKEIVSFDRSKKMDPGTYQLTPPCPSGTLAAVRKRAKVGRKASPRKAQRTKYVRHQTTSIRVAR
jgi:hypothetical protein